MSAYLAQTRRCERENSATGPKQQDARLERRPGVSGRGQRTVEHWRGATLRMGLLYERAAVEFWQDVAEKGLGSHEPNGVEATEAARVGH